METKKLSRSFWNLNLTGIACGSFVIGARQFDVWFWISVVTVCVSLVFYVIAMYRGERDGN